MATGDILSCTILATGWEAEVKIEGMSTGGTYLFDATSNSLADASTAKVTFTVVSEGYSAAGVLGTKTRTVYGTISRKKAYNADTNPLGTVPDERADGPDVIVTVALSEFIYNDDKDGGAGTSGTNPTVTIGAGFYTQGGTPNNAATGFAVTNNSTLDYPTVIARWAVVPYQRVTTTFDLECVAFHKFAEYGKPVACVIFDVYEGESLITTDTVATMVKSSAADSLPCYKQTITASNYTDNAVITCQFTAYPWVGDADACRTTVGGTANALTLGPLPLLADSDDDYGVTIATVDTATGNDTTGTAVDIANIGTEVSCATVKKALALIAAYNNTNHSRNNANAGIIYLKSNNHAWTGGTGSATTGDVWVTVTRHPTVAKADACIAAGSAGYVATERMHVYDLTAKPTGYVFGGSGTRTFWLDHVDIVCAARVTVNMVNEYALTYNTFCTSAKLDWPFSHGTSNVPALIRGCVATEARGFLQAPYFGARATLTSQILTPSEGDSGHIISIDAANTIGAYCKHLRQTYPPAVDDQKADETALVCNVMESIRSSSQQILAVSAKGNRSSFNQIVWHNTMVGDRTLVGYNCADSVVSKGNDWTHINYSYRFNSDYWFATKHDCFAGGLWQEGDPDPGMYISGWSVLYAVGMAGNNSEEPRGYFHTSWPGFNGTIATTAGYVSDQSLTNAGEGGGNYMPAPGSVLVGKIASAAEVVIPYDIDGTAYAEGGCAGAYAEPYDPPLSGSGYRFWTYS